MVRMVNCGDKERWRNMSASHGDQGMMQAKITYPLAPGTPALSFDSVAGREDVNPLPRLLIHLFKWTSSVWPQE